MYVCLDHVVRFIPCFGGFDGVARGDDWQLRSSSEVSRSGKQLTGEWHNCPSEECKKASVYISEANWVKDVNDRRLQITQWPGR
jgi:hypothetical protein